MKRVSKFTLFVIPEVANSYRILNGTSGVLLHYPFKFKVILWNINYTCGDGFLR